MTEKGEKEESVENIIVNDKHDKQNEPEVDIHIDLYQKKLSKAEWDYMEIPESKDEIEILNLIKKAHLGHLYILVFLILKNFVRL